MALPARPGLAWMMPPTIEIASYREAYRLPGAVAFSLSGALARLPQAMVGLGTVVLLLAVRAHGVERG